MRNIEDFVFKHTGTNGSGIRLGVRCDIFDGIRNGMPNEMIKLEAMSTSLIEQNPIR